MKKLQFLLLLLVILQTSFVAAQKVSNINYRQEQSTIIVSYDLETKTPCKVNLFVSINGGTTWQGPLTKVSGDVGAKISSGSHSITWNVLDEFEELSGTNIKFQVRAEELKNQSIASINKALIKNPKDAKLYKLRGDLKQESDDTKGAIADYTKAIFLNPKYAEAYYERGKTKYLDHFEEANLKADILDFNKAISLNTKYADAYYIRAKVKNTLKDFIGSLNDANKVIELDSMYEDIYYLRGIIKYQLKNFEGANNDFERHVKNSNNPIEAYTKIAHFAYEAEDYNTAIVYFTKAKLDNNFKIYFGYCCSLNSIFEIFGDYYADTEVYLGIAFSKYKLKDYAGANSEIENFIEQSQDKGAAYRAIGIFYPYSYFYEEDYNKTITYLTKAIELNSNNKDSYYISTLQHRAKAKSLLNDYSGAVADYSKLIELNPNKGSNYSSRADAKSELNDYRGAIADYNKANELDPNYSYYYASRADAKFNMGDYKGAIADYTKAILGDPKDGESYLSRGDAKILIKDKVGACKDFSKAGELGQDRAYEEINKNCIK
jgi:tetratricopeptide (TPR) repeat protein